MKRVRLSFADINIEFVDREIALRQIMELAERGTYPVYIVYGPEGCGKTAFFKQAKTILEEEFGYNIVYVNPLARRLEEVIGYSSSLKDIVVEILKVFSEPYSKIVDVAIGIVGEVLRRLKRTRLAILMDDIFQAVGLDKAEVYTKMLLNLIEYPPGEYERIVVLVSSSEGITRERIGRHRWATFRIMWNMSREGFKQLYEQIPGEKPQFEEIWRITGGNPAALEQLYRYSWRFDRTIDDIAMRKNLRIFISSLSSTELEILKDILREPDVIIERLRESETQKLRMKLIELNLIVELWDRDPWLWIDVPPPEKDSELGIGKHFAWQTPLHREAVRRALER
ncbi:ATPase [Ignisphaera aggregans DSM 17230]|uniref:ATPase n=1 Tax=Ignisphaera aggregans (strain DSM 17230 / JCM 13409 / AQ1.S1) TaxID=583356 RepID=E0STD1_IGNAA|nr:ATPase [Ignisphaera aggregans DSM 17230]